MELILKIENIASLKNLISANVLDPILGDALQHYKHTETKFETIGDLEDVIQIIKDYQHKDPRMLIKAKAVRVFMAQCPELGILPDGVKYTTESVKNFFFAYPSLFNTYLIWAYG